jgi:hypothetical protein
MMRWSLILTFISGAAYNGPHQVQTYESDHYLWQQAATAAGTVTRGSGHRCRWRSRHRRRRRGGKQRLPSANERGHLSRPVGSDSSSGQHTAWAGWGRGTAAGSDQPAAAGADSGVSSAADDLPEPGCDVPTRVSCCSPGTNLPLPRKLDDPL